MIEVYCSIRGGEYIATKGLLRLMLTSLQGCDVRVMGMLI